MTTPYEESVSYNPTQQTIGFSPIQAQREFVAEDKSMEQLAQFSRTLGNELYKYQQQVNKDQMMEGYNLAFQQENSPEVSNEIQQAGRQLKADEKDAHAVAYDINRSGESGEVSLAVQNMSGWKRYGYVKGKAELAGQQYAGWLSDTFAKDEKTFYHPETGEQFKLSDTRTDPALRAFALAQLRSDFIDQQGLTGIKPAFLNEFAGKDIRTAESKSVEEARNAFLVGEGQKLYNETVNEFIAGRDLNLYFAKIVNSRKSNGQLYTFSEAWQELKRVLVNQELSGKGVNLEELMDQPIDNDPKGRTFGDLYGKSQFDQIRVEIKNATIDFMRQEDALEEEQADNYVEEYLKRAEENQDLLSPNALMSAKAVLVNALGQNASSAITKLNSMAKVLYDDKRNIGPLRAALQDLAARGQLRPEDLDDVPADLRNEFIGRAQTQAKQVAPNFKNDENAVRNIIKIEAELTPDKFLAPVVDYMVGDLVREYQLARQTYIDGGISPADASRRASMEIVKKVEDGVDNEKSKYYRDKETGNFDQYLKMTVPIDERKSSRNFIERVNTKRSIVSRLRGKAFDEPNLFFNERDIEELKTVLPKDPLLLKSPLSESLFDKVGIARVISREANVPLLSIITRQNDVLDLPALPEYANYSKAYEAIGGEAKSLMQNILDGSLTTNQRRRIEGTWKTPISESEQTSNLKERIRQLESGSNYNTLFKGYLEGFSRDGEDITNMTINQVVKYQKDYLAHQAALGVPSNRRSAAIGAYQMLFPDVAAKALGISLSTKFTPAIQDRLADYYLDIAGRQQYLNGTISAVEYNNGIARQFASVKASNGMGQYDTDGLNKAYGSVDDLIQ